MNHCFLNYAWHLTQIGQIWNIDCILCNLPMAKANRPFLALQWSSPTTCCPCFLIRNGLVGCMSALSGVQIAPMDQTLRNLSYASGILDPVSGLSWSCWSRSVAYLAREPKPCGKHPIRNSKDADSDFRTFFSSPIPERLYVLLLASNCWLEVMILAPEHQLCSKSKAWRMHFRYHMTIIKYLSVCFIIFLCSRMKIPEWQI